MKMPDAFAYRAALYCADCAQEIRDMITPSPRDRDDSEQWPQGPYPDGGGEADCPQHCDGCGLFLENPLTDDGAEYVESKAAEFDAPDSSWAEIAERADAAGKPALGEWVRYYLAPGL